MVCLPWPEYESATYPQAYAATFFAIPLVRWLLNKRRNAAIEERNQARLNAAASLERPALRAKLASAAKLASRTVIDDRDLVYSSDRCPSFTLNLQPAPAWG